MIGVVGPADSTALLLEIAREEGLADGVVGRSYGVIEEAPAIALELDPACRVLLFTGRAPYALARRSGALQAVLQYVPQSGADLYRTLLHLLAEFGGRLPRVSLDTLEPWVVREAYADIGLEPPVHLMSLDAHGDEEWSTPSGAIAAFHRDRYQAGDVDVCLTCIGSVDRQLQAEGIPSRRISHTRSALREALRQAHLAERLALTEATQPAAVLVQVPGLRGPRAGADGAGGTGRATSAYEQQRRRLKAREVVHDLAKRLQGRLTDLDDETFLVTTNRGIVEAAVSRLTADRGGPLRLDRLPADTRVGIGLGVTVPGAEDSARRALAMDDRPGDVHLAFPDGELVRVAHGQASSSWRTREVREFTLRMAAQLGIGPMALARLTRALRQVDATSVTASELAHAYGIEPRSARRLMGSLQRAGIASRSGRQGGPRAGRPQTVYHVDMARLVPADERRAGRP